MRDTLQPNTKALVRRLIDSGVKVVMVTQRDKLASEVRSREAGADFIFFCAHCVDVAGVGTQPRPDRHAARETS